MNVNDDSAAASSLKSMQEFLRRGENARVKTCSLVTTYRENRIRPFKDSTFNVKMVQINK